MGWTEEVARETTTASALAGLHGEDPLAVVAAVRWLGGRLRSGHVEVDRLKQVAGELTALAADPSPRVRQSVAEVAPYLPEAMFETIVPVLGEDRSAYVRGAAERARVTRAAIRRERANVKEEDARIEGWYRDLAPRTRAVARRIAAHETEYFVRRMCHEAEASFMTYTETMRKLRDALDAPALERATMRALVERVDERFRFFEHVLATGKRHARPVEPKIQREDLADILLDEVELVAARLPDRAARLAVDTSGVEKPFAMDADGGFLREAFGNILKNAVEAYDDGHAGPLRVTVTATTTSEAGEAIVTIRDWGAGMNEHDAARAFVPFASSKPGGTGFGLYIARRVAVAVHGGSLSLETTPGGGDDGDDAFAAAARARAGQAGHATEAEGAVVTRRHRALIVEDNAENAETLADIVGAMDMEVRVVTTLAELRALLESGFKPCLVLMDMQFPHVAKARPHEKAGESGIAMVQALWTGDARVPIVVVTAFRADPEYVWAMAELAVDGFCAKTNIGALPEKVRHAMKKTGRVDHAECLVRDGVGSGDVKAETKAAPVETAVAATMVGVAPLASQEASVTLIMLGEPVRFARARTKLRIYGEVRELGDARYLVLLRAVEARERAPGVWLDRFELGMGEDRSMTSRLREVLKGAETEVLEGDGRKQFRVNPAVAVKVDWMKHAAHPDPAIKGLAEKVLKRRGVWSE